MKHISDKIEWHIGSSGFYYKDWKGIFYPEKLAASKWFAFYCSHFNTLESNVTFYRLPKLSALSRWYDISPIDFSFSVKAPRLITHYKKFKNVEDDLSSFYNLVQAGFKEKLACVLFQFPPQFEYNEERCQDIIKKLSHDFINVLEFRHESWWKPGIINTIKEQQIVFCNISYPKLKETFIETFPITYFRFHGVPNLFQSSYSKEYLAAILEKTRLNKKSKRNYFYFNNTMHGAALDNISYLQGLLLNNILRQT